MIEDVVHKAYIEVEEEGTEAAAATGTVMRKKNGDKPKPLIVDRPFIFIIRDNETGTILFIGRVLDPSL